MNIPKQSVPVRRQPSQAKYDDRQVGLSSIECDLCMLACNQLSGIAKALCIEACRRTVC